MSKLNYDKVIEVMAQAINRASTDFEFLTRSGGGEYNTKRLYKECAKAALEALQGEMLPIEYYIADKDGKDIQVCFPFDGAEELGNIWNTATEYYIDLHTLKAGKDD